MDPAIYPELPHLCHVALPDSFSGSLDDLLVVVRRHGNSTIAIRVSAKEMVPIAAPLASSVVPPGDLETGMPDGLRRRPRPVPEFPSKATNAGVP